MRGMAYGSGHCALLAPMALCWTNKELNLAQLQVRIPLTSVRWIHAMQRRQCDMPASVAKLMQRTLTSLDTSSIVSSTVVLMLLAVHGQIFSTVAKHSASRRPTKRRHCVQAGKSITLDPLARFFKSALWTRWPGIVLLAVHAVWLSMLLHNSKA